MSLQGDAGVITKDAKHYLYEVSMMVDYGYSSFVVFFITYLETTWRQGCCKVGN